MRGAALGKKTSGLQQKNVEVKTKTNKQKTPGNGDGGSTSETPQPPRKKRARGDPTVENEETFMNRVEVKVKIPEELKRWLVDDWDLITRQKQLFYLPAKKNVNSILEDYANYKKSRGNIDNKEYAVNEVVAGIKEYFNVMLGTQLLYKFERPQYAEILADHPDAPMSQVYGAPHLLRLFVRIGAMLAYTPLDEKSLALLLNYLHDFLKYLSKNSATLFSASDYEVAPPEYHRKAVQKQLFYLPAKKNVDSILEDYASYKKSQGNTDNKEYAVNEVVAGIKEYFNVMLGTQLLYKFERPQYAEILADHPDAPMSQVYGAPHLLRLFVRIGAMLAYTPLDEKSLALLLNYLHDFLKYLAKNSATLFSASDYEVAPPEYHRKAV
ncbi:Mortality factor 4-like protein 1 [Microtus ochrogaster]|uniref:Mortality factor 4-like protein 2 n=1 Tax=Microtus ochrogaster TaxID=79684 RepID=A0A8J6GGT5_MICOH|nr:Mortality factor 4-like protein 1 [Microtus ochrogaster]